MTKTNSKLSAFTLIEILVVVAIIGVLAALGTTGYLTAQRQSRDAKRLGDIRSIMTALEQYYTDKGRYPDSNNTRTGCSGAYGNWCCSSNGGGGSGWIKDGFDAYMGGSIPNQVGGIQGHCYTADSTSAQSYYINYSLENKMPNAIGTTSDTASPYRYSVGVGQ